MYCDGECEFYALKTKVDEIIHNYYFLNEKPTLEEIIFQLELVGD